MGINKTGSMNAKITGLGALVWLLLASAYTVGWVRLTLIELLFLLAPWAIVPLGVGLLPEAKNERTFLPAQQRMWLMSFGAVFVTAAFFLPPGGTAASLSVPWFLVCLVYAWDGLRRMLRYRGKLLAEFCFAAGEGYLVVGGTWLILSRLGLQPMGFQEPIVLLTAVHFHFAGFLSALLAGLTYERLQTARWAGYLRVALLGTVLGAGLLGLAFLIGPPLKLVAALLIVFGQFGLAFGMLRVAVYMRPSISRWLLIAASASVVGGMLLAAAWAIGEYPLHALVDLDRMTRIHGVVNALGFGLCGMFGWNALKREEMSLSEAKR